ncbi:unnamed protein product, partial [Rotaria magnacalcarata]
SNKAAAAQKCIQHKKNYLTYRTWLYTTRSLYDEYRLMFTLLVVLRIDLRRGKLRHEEFKVLVKGGASLDLNTYPPNLELLWDESNSKISLLGLFASDVDPTSNIQTLTKKKNIYLFIVSMGEGQEILERRCLQQNVQSGGSILLQNAYLGLDYLEEFHE